jgi:hypothetical protein
LERADQRQIQAGHEHPHSHSHMVAILKGKPPVSKAMG